MQEAKKIQFRLILQTCAVTWILCSAMYCYLAIIHQIKPNKIDIRSEIIPAIAIITMVVGVSIQPLLLGWLLLWKPFLNRWKPITIASRLAFGISVLIIYLLIMAVTIGAIIEFS